MHAVLLGASKGVGYYALLNLLAHGTPSKERWTATLLLRKPEVTRNDPKLSEYFAQGRIEIVQGDATVEDDVAKLFSSTQVDLVVTSVGAAPTVGWKGISIDQPDLCTRSTLALLHVLARIPQGTGSIPRVVAVSSMGIGENHAVLPWAMRVFYNWALEKPHADKEALEYLLSRAASAIPSPPAPAPSSHLSALLSTQEIESVKESFLPEVIVVRGAFYVGGDAPARGRDATRVGERVEGLYTVRRSELGRFVAEDCTPGQDLWVNKFPMVGY